MKNHDKGLLVERASRGVVLFIIGVIKKAMIGDQVATYVDPLFAKASAGVFALC